MVDDAKLHQFIGQMLSDLGGAASIALVRMGDSLGLYKALHARGPMTVVELAAAAGVNQRYLREWLSHQAASNYLSYDPATQKFALPEEQAMVFAMEDSPVYMAGAFEVMAAMLENQAKVEPAFSGPVAAWRGVIRPAACFARRRVFSVPAIKTTWSATGCRRSTASSINCSAVRTSRMSVAATAGPRC
jgi:hypothetical protein